MEYLQCNICLEAYFISEEARARHQLLCSAVKLAATQSLKRHSDSPNNKKRKVSATSTSAGKPIKHKCKASVATASTPARHPQKCKASAATVASAVDACNAPTSELQWVVKRGLSSARDYVIANNNLQYKDLAPFLEASKPLLTDIMGRETSDAATKTSLMAESLYEHPEGMQDLFNFKTTAKMVHSSEEAEEVLQSGMQKLLQEESEAANKGSGWSLVHPTSITLRVSKFSIVKPPGNGNVTLPKKLADRKATVQIKNTDEKCFLYCLLVKHLPEIPDSLDEQTFANVDIPYNIQGLRFPLSVTQVKNFECRNPGCSANVFETGRDCVIIPLKIVERELDDPTDLLVYKSGDSSHYILLTDFAKLIKPQLAKGRHVITECKRCYTYREARRCRPDAATWLA